MTPRAFLRSPRPAALAGLVLAGALSGLARAETLSLRLTPGTPAALTIDAPLDDTNFQDPAGYNERGHAARFFNPRITLTNTGTVPLTGRLLVVNGRDESSPEALRATLRLPPEPRAFVPRLFAFWKSRVTHADSDTEAGKEPLALLQHWGYALCGDNTTALARLLHGRGVPARKVPLNGHVAAEYFYDGGWHLFDGDQNAFYLRLDNRTPASADDLRADPFLALRTKIFGPAAAMSIPAAVFNTALFEHLAPRENQPLKLPAALEPLRPETLHPGEKIIYHRDRAPARAVGKTDLTAWPGTREDGLGIVELVLNSAARRTPSGEVVIRTASPIIEVVNQTTGERFPSPPGEPVFQTTLQPRAATDRLAVFCQQARAALPVFGKGANTAVLQAAATEGTALLEVEIEPTTGLVPPAATLRNSASPEAPPELEIQAPAGVDRLWWQVSGDQEFASVAPNFDNLIAPAARLAFDPLTATFFNPGQPYFARIKARRDGVWGEWSAPLAFTVSKPARPAPVSVTAPRGRLRLAWPDAGAGAEYLVFGSNRRDFLPELFAAEEITAMRDQQVEKTRPNRNLVATVAQPVLELTPAFRFYRIITRRGAVLSVPGDLIVTPRDFTAQLPPATILQDRWTRAPDPAARNGYRDVHLTTETALPP